LRNKLKIKEIEASWRIAMNKGLQYLSLAGCLAAGTAIAAIVPVVVAQQNSPGNFPDTQNYWAKPFIAALAQRDVVNGYPDGTRRICCDHSRSF
jgi:hypothetical protein